MISIIKRHLAVLLSKSVHFCAAKLPEDQGLKSILNI